MEKEFVKQCPYCNSIKTSLQFNPQLKRMVSKCLECNYSGTSVFLDVEKSMAKQAIRVKSK